MTTARTRVRTTSSPKLIRTMNQRELMRLLFADGPLTRPELSQRSGLSQPTVIAALGGLEEAGLVRGGGNDERALGRPAKVYRAADDAGSVTAIDIGRVWLRVTVVDITGRELSRADMRNHAHSAAELVDLIADTVRVARHGARDAAPATVTVIGSPGVLAPQGETMAYADQLPGWHGPHLMSSLKEVLGEDLIIDNDVNLAGYAEAVEGAGRDLGSFAYLHIGTGVGLASLLDGRLWRGAHGAAGELAYVPTHDPTTNAAVPLERLVCAPALSAQAAAAGLEETSPEGVLERSAAGEPGAVAVMEAFCEHVATAIITIIGILDPQRIIIGGGLGEHLGDHLERISQRVSARSPFTAELALGGLGSQAALRGAVVTGLSAARERLFTSRLTPP